MIIYILVAVFLLLGGIGKTAKIIFPIGFFRAILFDSL